MPNRGDYRKISIEQRIELVEQIYVSYPRLEELLAKIEHCRQHSLKSAEPECMLIKGDTGAGKSTLCSQYEQRRPRHRTAEGDVIPVLSATIPVPATPKSLASKLLFTIGDPLADRGTTVSMTLRLYKLMEDCHVHILVLDEFQHFKDRDSKKVLQTISDWLKELLNETRIPIVLLGMPYCEEVLKANRQLQRRFAVQETLEPFGWNHSDPKVQEKLRKDFRRFLKVLDDQLPLVEASHLADPEMAFRIYCATDGVVASVMKLIRRAVVIALESGLEGLTLEILSLAYIDRLAAHRLHPRNPFLP